MEETGKHLLSQNKFMVTARDEIILGISIGPMGFPWEWEWERLDGSGSELKFRIFPLPPTGS